MIKVGDRFENTKGSEYVVVEYKNKNNVTIEFCDKHKYRTTRGLSCVKTGNIKNPYEPLLFGIGYFGIGEHKSKDGSSKNGYSSLPSYSAWTNMLSRCYDKNYPDPHVYERTEVHSDWHCFQTFADWYMNELSNNKWIGKSYLDKDILGDSYTYSSTNCCLVSARINSAIAVQHGGVHLPGVFKSSTSVYKVVSGYLCSNTRFTNEKSAHLAFVEAKSERIKELANEYKEYLRPDVYETLITKDFRFKFSPFYQKPQNLIGVTQ